ncbi:hypothetical protein M413DRAFT_443285 [Hebeloma cylindrosporum]|uniref:Uncharacterized protein n=1 Tax=Hebeloma cylindrosporum TaxID=76867 RepID=A0A0C3C5X6_HEBCY|nr:hypothetical protein M413DRAFT_443285 [Hebeloma cylindrosporum h7]
MSTSTCQGTYLKHPQVRQSTTVAKKPAMAGDPGNGKVRPRTNNIHQRRKPRTSNYTFQASTNYRDNAHNRLAYTPEYT